MNVELNIQCIHPLLVAMQLIKWKDRIKSEITNHLVFIPYNGYNLILQYNKLLIYFIWKTVNRTNVEQYKAGKIFNMLGDRLNFVWVMLVVAMSIKIQYAQV